MFDKAAEELRKILHSDQIVSTDNSLIIKPGSAEDVSAVLKVANRTKTPVRPKGGGSGWWSSTKPPENGILLQMTAMDKIIKIDEDLLTVTAQAGITYSALEKALSEKGFQVKIFPESSRMATLGGHIQTWGTSPYSSSFYEDQSTQLLGLKVVLPTGEIISTGSGAVPTSPGQYHRRFFPADLTGLFTGSEGAFGVITEVTLKIHHNPESIITRVIGFRETDKAVSLMTRLQNSQRSGEILTLVEQRWVSRQVVIDVVPRMADRLPENINIYLVVRTEGSKKDAAEHMEQVSEVCREVGEQMFQEEIPEWWEGKYDKSAAALVGKGPRVMIVAMTPFKLIPRVLSIIEQYSADYNLDLKLFGYPFGGPVFLAHTVFPWVAGKPETRETAQHQARTVMKELIEIGCVPHRVGSDFLPVINDMLDPEYRQFIRKLKEMLDPNGIMNPGVVVEN
ncbi:MAG: FAD-binding oxidoreductase [Bacillota bacterium]|nr:FAD-binding oxidoreductase [Bacillota bacterium]